MSLKSMSNLTFVRVMEISQLGIVLWEDIPKEVQDRPC